MFCFFRGKGTPGHPGGLSKPSVCCVANSQVRSRDEKTTPRRVGGPPVQVRKYHVQDTGTTLGGNRTLDLFLTSQPQMANITTSEQIIQLIQRALVLMGSTFQDIYVEKRKRGSINSSLKALTTETKNIITIYKKACRKLIQPIKWVNPCVY